MVRDNHGKSSEQERSLSDWSRRSILKAAGAGTGLAAIGGLTLTGAGQEDGETPPPDDGSETPTEPQPDHFVADIVDPVFGYPLAEGETDDVAIDHVVNVTVEEGTGAHENFPAVPDGEAPGEMMEGPAEFIFDPVGHHVEPDSLVHFNTVAGLHTVTAFHDKFVDPQLDIPTRVPDEVPGFTSPPLMPGESWIYQFTEKGVYDYLCLPHMGLGMVGRIVVFDSEEDDIATDQFAAPTTGELPPNVERVLGAPELDPANIVESGSVAWGDLTLTEPDTPTPTPTATPETPTTTETDDGS